MATYKTPGVYVEEITTLPPSVAEVETAIPAFIGFTQLGAKNVPKRITSMVEYQEHFGKAEAERNNITVTVEVKTDNTPDSNVVVAGGILDAKVTDVKIDFAARSKNVMYYALQLFFANGGGPCYIIPAGNYDDTADNPKAAYSDALHVSSMEDEPTLLVFPDACMILPPNDYYDIMNQALIECSRLKDRFVIIDVINVERDTKASVELFRNKISSNLIEIKYGAAYHPYLNTNLKYQYVEEEVKVRVVGGADAARRIKAAEEALEEARRALAAARAEVERLKALPPDDPDAKKIQKAERDIPTAEAKVTKAEGDLTEARKAETQENFTQQNNAIRNQIKNIINTLGVQLSPCSAVAGVYASIDNTRGVWKAPANVSLNYVASTTAKITDEDQQDLNIDVTAGKSVNAIRSFIGMGTKIWGARTLAGNDNEWRYINVRRFFNMVEESVKKSTYWAVFEPNDINTWVRVRAMIENYLLLKWKDGALAGAKPEDAFFVRVGLGQTMTPLDVLEGRMIIEIGLAAVRPAEFIILKFSHKLQNS